MKLMEDMNILRKRSYWPTNEWKIANPREKGMNSEYLVKMHEYIKKKCYFMRSVLVIRDGYIVYEEYNNGFSKEDLQEQWSITKSIISALIGILIKDGMIKNAEQSMMEFFDYNFQVNEQCISKIKLRNLLNMTSGFLWNNDIYKQWLKSDSLVDFILKSDTEYEPEEHFYYDDHNAYMLSAIITKLSGLSTEKYAERHLFEPLGIKNYKWEKDNKGINIGGYGAFLTSRDMAKLGYLYANHGIWEDKQIIDIDWINVSTSVQSKGGLPERDAYGYMWWVSNVDGYLAYYACGFGGQYIYIIPELDIVFVSTASPYAAHQENKNLVKKFIIPSTYK